MSDGPFEEFGSGDKRTGLRRPPFSALGAREGPQHPLRAAIANASRRPERDCLPMLLEQARLAPSAGEAARTLAEQLVVALRRRNTALGVQGLVPNLLNEYPLSSHEGVALMCLAEALLRIPDTATREALIRDKIAGGDWKAHLGHSSSLLVNAAAWGLLITGKLVGASSEAGLEATISRLVAKGGAPVVSAGIDMAIRMMSEQFVVGETIEQALLRARRYESAGFRYSYDMLGEAALTEEDAARYFGAYKSAIQAVGAAAGGRGPYEGPGVSVKLSALHPRYGRNQRDRVMREGLPRLKALALLARRHGVGLSIDAEEANRLELSLDILEALCTDDELRGWNGIGIAVQAYLKRAPFVIDWLIDLARRTRCRLMIRLVKGAYWDSEIKRAQVEGLDDYPCYTRKAHTDVCFLACARKLLSAADAVYPQFATHNAYSLAAVYYMAGPSCDPARYEFQCLHGMGEPLYEEVVGAREAGKLGRPCRIYAPVGLSQLLLPYLVRRLLENGANSSFIRRVANAGERVEDLVADPLALARSVEPIGAPHPAIPLPVALFGNERDNSTGIDLSDERELAGLSLALGQSLEHDWVAHPILGIGRGASGERKCVVSPADRRDIVGWVVDSTLHDVAAALDCAVGAAPAFAGMAAQARAAILRRASDLFDAARNDLVSLAVREAGKTLPAALAEVREAIDFLRYHAAQLTGDADLAHGRARGPLACISPWNFPLAIFTGQISAALATGNPVIAKPAEQTPLIAAHAVRLLRQAGVPAGALQLLPGPGETIGAALIADPRVQAVMFTGSTEVAKLIQRVLAERFDNRGHPVLLVAETGGQNAMIVDSSALTEQVVTDAIQSAFDSAGQRCSSLRVLCLQEEIADRILRMLRGALRELSVGLPGELSTDVGPIIDAPARETLREHIERMRAKGRQIDQAPLAQATEHGTFLPPTLIEIDALRELEREVFGPVLHVLRFRHDRLEALLDEIAATGYGLTLGIHSRVDETIERIVSRARAGNIYVNRNMIGAVVGVQPFGGEGLSGTGPKAGGPLFLRRLGRECRTPPITGGERRAGVLRPAEAYRDWLASLGHASLGAAQRYLQITALGIVKTLPGPTGEDNTYSLRPKGAVLCLADTDDQLLAQLAATFATGNRAVLVDGEGARRLRDALPEALRNFLSLTPEWTEAQFEHALHAGSREKLQEFCRDVAARPGPVIGVQAPSSGALPYALDPLLSERSLSVNTAAAGGNASLMTIV